MTALSEKVRQLAPHWAAMFVVMFVLLAVVESLYGDLSFWSSVVLVVAVAVGYPMVVRYFGAAPELWQRN